MPRAAWLVIVIFGLGLAAFGLSGCAIYPGYGCDSNYGYAACNDNQLYAPDYFGAYGGYGLGMYDDYGFDGDFGDDFGDDDD